MVMRLGPQGQFKWLVFNLQYCTYFFAFRPNGAVSSLQLPELNSKFYRVRFPADSPEQAHFVSTVPSKGDLFRGYFHYTVSTLSALSKRCRSCRKPIDLETPCIQTYIECILCYERTSLTLKLMQLMYK
jgi:hypothetical protein